VALPFLSREGWRRRRRRIQSKAMNEVALSFLSREGWRNSERLRSANGGRYGEEATFTSRRTAKGGENERQGRQTDGRSGEGESGRERKTGRVYY
jgi:hypothetical protein